MADIRCIYLLLTAVVALCEVYAYPSYTKEDDSSIKKENRFDHRNIDVGKILLKLAKENYNKSEDGLIAQSVIGWSKSPNVIYNLTCNIEKILPLCQSLRDQDGLHERLRTTTKSSEGVMRLLIHICDVEMNEREDLCRNIHYNRTEGQQPDSRDPATDCQLERSVNLLRFNCGSQSFDNFEIGKMLLTFLEHYQNPIYEYERKALFNNSVHGLETIITVVMDSVYTENFLSFCKFYTRVDNAEREQFKTMINGSAQVMKQLTDDCNSAIQDIEESLLENNINAQHQQPEPHYPAPGDEFKNWHYGGTGQELEENSPGKEESRTAVY